MTFFDTLLPFRNSRHRNLGTTGSWLAVVVGFRNAAFSIWHLECQRTSSINLVKQTKTLETLSLTFTSDTGWPDWANFLHLSKFYLWSFLWKKIIKAQNFGQLFSLKKLNSIKYGLGYILGDFTTKASGHPDQIKEAPDLPIWSDNKINRYVLKENTGQASTSHFSFLSVFLSFLFFLFLVFFSIKLCLSISFLSIYLLQRVSIFFFSLIPCR
jgi:hypothetical protein